MIGKNCFDINVVQNLSETLTKSESRCNFTPRHLWGATGPLLELPTMRAVNTLAVSKGDSRLWKLHVCPSHVALNPKP